MLSFQAFMDGIEKIEAVFRRPGGFQGHEPFYQSIAASFTESSWKAAVVRYLAHGQKFPLPADLLQGRAMEAKRKEGHLCQDCQGHAGWVYERQPVTLGNGRERVYDTCAPCPNRRDSYATAFYARRQAEYGPGVTG